MTFDEFIEYLKSTWGKLSIIMLLFPISNIFFNVIPIPENFNKNMHIAFAMILSYFTIFILYSIKEHIWKITRVADLPRRNKKNFINIVNIPFYSIVFGILSLFLYYDFTDSTFFQWIFCGPDNVCFSYNLAALVLYSFFYIFFTFAFTFSALVEYMEKQK